MFNCLHVVFNRNNDTALKLHFFLQMPNDDLISRIENDNIAETSDYSPPLSRALINIWIPSSFLKGKGANSHHLFQVSWKRLLSFCFSRAVTLALHEQ